MKNTAVALPIYVAAKGNFSKSHLNSGDRRYPHTNDRNPIINQWVLIDLGALLSYRRGYINQMCTVYALAAIKGRARCNWWVAFAARKTGTIFKIPPTRGHLIRTQSTACVGQLEKMSGGFLSSHITACFWPYIHRFLMVVAATTLFVRTTTMLVARIALCNALLNGRPFFWFDLFTFTAECLPLLLCAVV